MAELACHRVGIGENLRDAGCDEEFIRQYLEMEERSDEVAQAAALDRYRQSLLEKIHREEKKLDILDYFIYNRKRSERT